MRTRSLEFARFVAVLAVLFLALAVQAQEQPPAESLEMPPELRPWVGWVTADLPNYGCPVVGTTRHCLWPGRLAIDVRSGRADFVYQVYLDRESDVALPGDADFWPQRVKAGARDLVVTQDAAGRPQTRLPAGSYRIEGRLEWAQVPDVIQIPDETGSISLSTGADAVDFPRIEGTQLFLGEGAAGATEETDSVRASVYRRIQDGIPVRVTTRVELNVAGRAREVELGKLLLDNSRPVSSQSPIPTRVQPDGMVTAYVRPGTHTVEIESVVSQPVEALNVPSPTVDFYDPQEVWVWIPDEVVRSVKLDGLTSVDSERTSLPSDWRGQTTFLAEPGQSLTLEVTRRGASDTAPNLIHLNRTMWLDLDGRGYTVRDDITGTMNREWRLDYAAEGALGRVRDRTEDTDLFITRSPDGDKSGVELRKSNLNLRAELRLDDARNDVAVVGWDHDLQSLSATLQLPPGWTLIGGTGVDKLPGTWLESWTLWDFFFLLMVALSIGKLCGWWWTPISAIALCLAHGHPEAPQWVWIHLIVSLALLRVLPNNNWRRAILVYRSIALLALVVILAPYARDQIRYALHPQAAQIGDVYSSSDQAYLGVEEKVAMEQEAMPASAEPPMPRIERSDGGPDWISNPVSRKKGMKSYSTSTQQQLQQVDPNAVVQTGPGLPTWSWTSWQLQWVGPVRSDHRISLWLISPLHNMWLAFLRVILLILIALVLVAHRDMYWREPRNHLGATMLTSVFKWTMVVSAAALVAGAPQSATAQNTPPVPNQAAVGGLGNLGAVASKDMLGVLRARLMRQAECERCVSVSEAEISVRGTRFEMSAIVHARKDAGWHLPGPINRLSINTVSIDGVETTQLRRTADGLTAVRIPQGRHSVRVIGRLANQNVVTLQFDPETRPRRVTFTSRGWSIDGLSPNGVPDSSLQLTRKAESGDETGAQQTELEPWFNVRREFNLGLPWQVRTIVTRADSSRPQLAKFPVMDGEQVITESVRVEDKRALVDFGRGEERVEYLSEIPVRDEFTITASDGEPWSETWTVACSRIWHCGFEGIPPTERVTNGEYQPMWLPWPGESLTVRVLRPEGAPGQASTVDRVEYQMTPGKRLMQATLGITVRASQGSRQTVTLPEGAELQTVTIDGASKNIRPQDGVVSLPVKPGSQKFVLTWQQPWNRHVVEQMPAVDIGSSAVNVQNSIRLGSDRWLLAVQGPDWGPAILFWSHLIILLILAFLLGRLQNLPVATWEWLLLVIGLSQLPVIAGLPLVLWFVLLAWRRRENIEPWWRFDLVQLTAIFLTILSLGALYAAIHTNLLFDIDMQVKGAGSTNSVLQWYVGQSDGALPTPTIISVPILVWRVLMLLWAFWLVSRLIKWARWGWDSFSDGGLWKKPKRSPKPDEDGGDEAPDESVRVDVSRFARAQEESPDPPPPESLEDISTPEDEQPETDQSDPPPGESTSEEDSGARVEQSSRRRRKKQDTIPGGPQATSELGSGETGSKVEDEKTPIIFPPPNSEAEDDQD